MSLSLLFSRPVSVSGLLPQCFCLCSSPALSPVFSRLSLLFSRPVSSLLSPCLWSPLALSLVFSCPVSGLFRHLSGFLPPSLWSPPALSLVFSRPVSGLLPPCVWSFPALCLVCSRPVSGLFPLVYVTGSKRAREHEAHRARGKEFHIDSNHFGFICAVASNVGGYKRHA